jgi:hypothetical protein
MRRCGNGIEKLTAEQFTGFRECWRAVVPLAILNDYEQYLRCDHHTVSIGEKDGGGVVLKFYGRMC